MGERRLTSEQGVAAAADLSAPALLRSLRQTLIQDTTLAENLRAAADGARLRPWTELLTAAMARACERLGLEVAAKYVGGSPLPVTRSEYLGIDVCGFLPGAGWRPLAAAFELENSQRFDLIAYALWKAASVRAPLSGLICYRRDPDDIPQLVGELGSTVLSQIGARDGDFLVLVGTRVSASAFPDGYFKPFLWDQEASRFTSQDLLTAP